MIRTVPGVTSVSSASAPGRGQRRAPSQQRSQERVTRLLDACAELLDEVGYEALSTSEVARRAGVPVGSLYQFFDGKQALCAAVARRNMEQFLTRIAGRLVAAPPRTWAEAAPVVVGEFVGMKRSVPGFLFTTFGSEGEDGHNALVAEYFVGLAVGRLGLPARPDAALVVRVATELVDSLVRMAFAAGQPGDQALIEEAERVLTLYLGSRLDAEPA